MNADWLEWALALVLILAMPGWGKWEFERLRASVEAGRSDARLRAYRMIVLVQWILVAMVAGIWWSTERSPADLYLRTPSGVGGGIALLLTGLGLILLLIQGRQARADDEVRTRVREEMRPLAFLLPHDETELRGFAAASLTAGVCEELLYRAFLPWFFAQWLPVPLAFALGAVAFGLGHLYQGPANVLKTGGLGLILAATVWISGSVLPAMILHASIDLLNGRLGYDLLSEEAV